ncbi:serine/threonine-protein kinase 19 homolog isoform X2 [Amborella trichopoda]|uniref:serine/threonine-protein kinase 19 homolog isoform X2 n=1 Tax=Amborella trichopoda TaxID=13333 RepID=UPI0009BCF7E0|nr:serine/threonine-protein kinase 19 homolog isoform X2 [Amborella trichopoda]|eukprot:XP_020531029.1 serine/threonine-protein kinase 19 homolog isoform X2 [Amborella trichopoda]
MEDSATTGRKRVREDHEEEPDVGLPLENQLTFSDTLIALRIMHAQFPKMEKVSVQPFVLRSQVYSSVNDRTQVDRELESLRKDNVIRLFKLNTGQDDHAIMFIEDYLNQVESAMKRIKAKGQDDIDVFEWFRSHVLPSKLDASIEHEELCLLLSHGGNVKDDHISLLINAGLLGLSQGRKELISLLNRRKYKEMLLALLEKKRLRLSPLDIRFHLRDLIGSGYLKTVHTPAGLLVKVVKE